MKKIILFFITILFFIIAYFIYQEFACMHLTAKFKELRPLHGRIPIYYKGIVIGKTMGIKHSFDGEHTLIKLLLYPNKLLLPENTVVYLKKEKKNNKEQDFLEFIYPKKPSNIMISNYSVLNGYVSSDMDMFLSNQNPESLEAFKKNLIKTTENLANATESLAELLDNLNSTLNSSKENIINTTQNIENMTGKFDNSINQNKLNETISNIETTTESINNILDDTSNSVMPTINATTENVNNITENINAITCGVRKTLRKKCGMLRLIFGQVIDECNK